jgi:hypothetical protein
MEIGKEADKVNRKEKGEKKPFESHPKQAEKTEQEIKELKARDAEVKKHEQAHKSAAGAYYVSGPHFEYKAGPDGHRYAVSGNVKIDTSEVSDDPEATVKKARQVKRAALAPADPSPQDRQVAAEAARMELLASQEIAKQQAEEMKTETVGASSAAASAEEPNSTEKSLEEFSPAKFHYDVGILKQSISSGDVYTSKGKVSALNSKFGKINVKI